MNILNKIKTVVLLSVFVIAGGVSIFYTRQLLMASPVGTPYGGFVTYIPCTCSGALVLLNFTPGFVGPVPSTFQMTYVLGSEGFAYWNMGVQQGIWSLGEFAPPAPCMMAAVPVCIPFGAPIGTVEPLTGTSL